MKIFNVKYFEYCLNRAFGFGVFFFNLSSYFECPTLLLELLIALLFIAFIL